MSSSNLVTSAVAYVTSLPTVTKVFDSYVTSLRLTDNSQTVSDSSTMDDDRKIATVTLCVIFVSLAIVLSVVTATAVVRKRLAASRMQTTNTQRSFPPESSLSVNNNLESCQDRAAAQTEVALRNLYESLAGEFATTVISECVDDVTWLSAPEGSCDGVISAKNRTGRSTLVAHEEAINFGLQSTVGKCPDAADERGRRCSDVRGSRNSVEAPLPKDVNDDGRNSDCCLPRQQNDE